jgi:parallel beta-helix repeat protein
VVLNCSIDANPGSGSPPALYGICMDESMNNTIMFCDIFNANTTFSNGYGFYLDDSDNNHVYQCFIHDNNKGLFFTSSSDNYIAIINEIIPINCIINRGNQIN